MLYGWICMCFGMMIPCCMLKCMLVCVWVWTQVLNMILSRLRRKIQWWETNLRVGRSWVPNTFPKMYLNSEPISLILRSIFLPRCYIHGSLGHYKTRWRLIHCVHSGDSTGDNEFNSFVCYFLNLDKNYFNTFAHILLGFFCPLTSVGDGKEDGRLHSGPNLPEFIPPTHNRCHRL